MFTSIFAQAQKGFEVKIVIDGINDNKIRVYSQRNNKTVIDTLVQDAAKTFLWKGVVEDPQFARIDVLDTALYLKAGKAVALPPSLMFLLTNTNYTITGPAKDFFKATIKSDNAEVNAYEKFRIADMSNTAATWALQQRQNKLYNLSDTVGKAEIAGQLQFFKKKNQKERAEFIDNNPNDYASLLMLQSLFLILSTPDLDQKFSTFPELNRNTKTGVILYNKIESNKNTALGKPIISFSQVGIDGEIVNTDNFKGKVVLVDFWGSWCVPCRRSHPALKKLYEKYKSKGFEIIGISNEMTTKTRTEQDKAWRKAVKEDGINWAQILYDPTLPLDLVKAFDINGYPTKFLIDQNGKFILRLLGDSEALHKSLEAKLAELMPD